MHYLRALAIDLAADRERGPQHLQYCALQLLGQALVPQLARDLNDLVERNRLGVLDVLLLLAVAWRLFERFDDERGCRGNDGHGGLTILDCEADGDTETFLRGSSAAF